MQRSSEMSLSCSPEAQEVHAHQDDQVCQLPPRGREKPIVPMLGAGKEWKVPVFLGLLKVRFRGSEFYFESRVQFRSTMKHLFIEI